MQFEKTFCTVLLPLEVTLASAEKHAKMILILSTLSLQYKKILTKDDGNLGTVERFVSGSLAGATAQTSIYPMEVSNRKSASVGDSQMSGAAFLLLKVLEFLYPNLFSLCTSFQNFSARH